MLRPETDAIFSAHERGNSVWPTTTSPPRRFYPNRPKEKRKKVGRHRLSGQTLKDLTARSHSLLTLCSHWNMARIGPVGAAFNIYSDVVRVCRWLHFRCANECRLDILGAQPASQKECDQVCSYIVIRNKAQSSCWGIRSMRQTRRKLVQIASKRPQDACAIRRGYVSSANDGYLWFLRGESSQLFGQLVYQTAQDITWILSLFFPEVKVYLCYLSYLVALSLSFIYLRKSITVELDYLS